MGRLEQPRQNKTFLYRQDKLNESTKKGPFSFVLFESPFTSVSTDKRGHPSPVSLVPNIHNYWSCTPISSLPFLWVNQCTLVKVKTLRQLRSCSSSLKFFVILRRWAEVLCSNLGSPLEGLAELFVFVHELVIEPGPQRGEELRQSTRVQVQP